MKIRVEEATDVPMHWKTGRGLQLIRSTSIIIVMCTRYPTFD